MEKTLVLTMAFVLALVSINPIFAQTTSSDEKLKKDWEKYIMSLDASDTSIEELCKAATDIDDEYVKVLAIRRIGQLFEEGGAKGKISDKVYKKVVDTLIYAIEEGRDRIVRVGNVQVNPFWNVRSEAAFAMAKVKDSSFIPYMIKAIRYDTDSVVKRSIALSFGKMKSREAVPVLIEVLEYTQDQALAGDIVKALGEIGDRRAFGPLIKVIRGPFMPKVKEIAQQSLEQIQWAEEPEEVTR